MGGGGSPTQPASTTAVGGLDDPSRCDVCVWSAEGTRASRRAGLGIRYGMAWHGMAWQVVEACFFLGTGPGRGITIDEAWR